jgi:sigma-B regulation protein RsbU (phosphoserine phosphatase)
MHDLNTQDKAPVILCIDDNPKNMKILNGFLERDGYEILGAASGEEAFALLQQRKPDLILLDIMMPVLDGFQVCVRLKQDESTKDIPVIFITAKSEPEDVVRGFELGAVDYITKPFNGAELLARVKTHVALKKARDRERKELLHARIIQRRFLPSGYEGIAGLSFSVRYRPIAEIGGDLYDIEEIEPSRIRIFLADAAGHGVQAALIAMLIKGEYEKNKRTMEDPGRLISTLNSDIVASYRKLSIVFPAILIDIDVKARMIHYCSAGFPTQYCLHDGGLCAIEQNHIMLGIADGHEFSPAETAFPARAKLLMFTDGLIDSVSGGEHDGNAADGVRLREELLNARDMHADQITERLLQRCSLPGSDRSIDNQDDITIICAESTI